MNTLQGLLIAYALLGTCCAAIEISEGHEGKSKGFLVGSFLATFLVWPCWLFSVCKDIFDGKGGRGR